MKKIKLSIHSHSRGWTVTVLGNVFHVDAPYDYSKMQSQESYNADTRLLPSVYNYDRFDSVSNESGCSLSYDRLVSINERYFIRRKNQNEITDEELAVIRDMVFLKSTSTKAREYLSSSKCSVKCRTVPNGYTLSDTDVLVSIALEYLHSYSLYVTNNKLATNKDIANLYDDLGFYDGNIEKFLDTTDSIISQANSIIPFDNVFLETISELLACGGYEESEFLSIKYTGEKY